MGNYRIDLAYLGGGFHGYAIQPNVRTVQGDLEAALERVLGPVESVVAGRTDKGVHASGQVVSFTTEAEVDCPRLQRSLNTQLRPEISVTALVPVAAGFHARFSAVERSYHYRILNRTAPDPFRAATSWHFPTPLDVDLMRQGCEVLVGRHDFASFCRAAPGRSTERDLRVVTWDRQDDIVELTVEASSFCHQMVRSIVAIAVDVGRRRMKPGAVADILAARDRRLGSGAAPAHGLTLVGVRYE